MHLIAPLAGGVAGCESGTFSIVRRGTTTPASYYTDFEGLTAPITGTDVPLDARGGGVFYVNELVKVTCKSAAGVTIREFVAGDEATCLDVRSDSFTGTHYQTAAVAAGNPITLKALLDKWDDSAGADDWKVRVSGADVTLQAAFSALQGQRRFVVTSYGAVGDGVTNDTSAINAALSAANAAGGGVVFFPPGNYVCTTVTAFSTVSIEGSGPGLTTVSLQSAFSGFISGAMAGVVRGIRFTFIGGLGNVDYISASPVVSGQSYLIEDCVFVKKSDLSGNSVIDFPSATAHRLTVNRCVIEIGASRAITAGNGCELRVFSSQIRAMNASVATSLGIGTNSAKSQIVGNEFDFSTITTGVAVGFSLGSGGSTLAVGNRIVPPGTAVDWTVFLIVTGHVLVESGNSTGATAANWGSAYRVYNGIAGSGSQFGSRSGAYISMTSNADPVSVPLVDAAVVRLRVTDGSGWTGNQNVGPLQVGSPGQQVVLMIWNDTAGSLSFDFAGNFPSLGTVAVAANSVRSFLFVAMVDAGGTNVDWFPVADIAGALAAE